MLPAFDTWTLAMFALLPLLAVGQHRKVALRGLSVPVPWGPMARTWAALFMAGFIASFFRYDQIKVFAVIDATAAIAVMLSPKGEAQRLIGFIFGGMVFVHAGFYSSFAGGMQPGPEGFVGYVELQRGLGWVQYVALLTGGGYAAYRHLVDSGHVGRRRSDFRVGAAQ